ncbi:MAG: hypothetical protein V2B15_20450 [Bacteroidota bacterium]
MAYKYNKYIHAKTGKERRTLEAVCLFAKSNSGPFIRPEWTGPEWTTSLPYVPCNAAMA